MASLPCSSQGKPLIAHLHRDLAIPPACWVTQRETFPNVSSDCFIPFVLIIARCIMQLLARAAFPLGWCRISLASPSHVWKLWELQELEFGARGSFRCEAEAWICDCSGGSQPFGNEKPAPNGVGEKKNIPFESFKIFDELICYRSPLILCFHIQLLIQKNTQVLT